MLDMDILTFLDLNIEMLCLLHINQSSWNHFKDQGKKHILHVKNGYQIMLKSIYLIWTYKLFGREF